MMTPLLTATGIAKRFGAVQALDDVRVSFEAGRVRAIVGENGAGKSTLAKVVAGLYAPDTGEIRWEGHVLNAPDRRLTRDLGIAFVPQSLSLIGTLTLVENHMLTAPGWRLNPQATRRALREAGEGIGIAVPMDVPVERLGLAQRQLGEIVSAVAAGARLLLLDEPTSALGPREIEALIATLRQLALRGQAVGLVTHRIDEVLQGADDVSVLRAGRLIEDAAVAGLDPEAVARMMVGERSRARVALPPVQTDWQRLAVEGLCVIDDGQALMDELSLSVKQGEILGIAGVSGPAQPALTSALAGLIRPAAGSIRVDGTEVAGDPAGARKAGLAHVPEDRAAGVAGMLSNAENASLLRLDRLGKGPLRDRAAETAHAEGIIAAFDVRPADAALRSGGLSGGNQQKLLIGRELAEEPSVVVVHGPTKGLDLAAAATIRAGIVDSARKGAAVLVISADLDELIEMCHRLIVLANGRITGEFDLSKPLDMGRLGQAMTDTSA